MLTKKGKVENLGRVVRAEGHTWMADCLDAVARAGYGDVRATARLDEDALDRPCKAVGFNDPFAHETYEEFAHYTGIPREYRG